MSVFEKIGELASPLQPALDFVMPGLTEPQQDPGGIINSLSRGVSDAVMDSPLGMLKGAGGLLGGEGSARERLLIGGLLAAGGVMSAKAAHRRWKATRPPAMMAARLGYTNLIDLGDKPRYTVQTPEAEQLARRRPGTNMRQLEMLAAKNSTGVVGGFRRFDPNDIEKVSAATVLVDRYSPDFEEAQVVFARFDQAIETGVFRYNRNEGIRDLWKKMVETPSDLLDDPAATEELFSVMRAFDRATDGIVTDNLELGVVGRIDRIDITDDGQLNVITTHPVQWNDKRIIDPVVRAERLKQLNYRNLSEVGYYNLRKLYEIGQADFELYQRTGSSLFDDGLELGKDWYPTALADVERVFQISADVDPDAVNRAVASVSFLSEAENWSTNITKARDVLRLAGDVGDEDFQYWLRTNPEDFIGSKADLDRHERRFKGIWTSVKKEGFKVADPDMKKVLRLYGGVETVDEVFRTTVARKQKNFYLNIRYPDLEHPVTIDRHAFDAFIGLDSGIQDRPIDKAMFDGDQVYDVVADTYRALAEDLGVHPHAVQAVIWETWRSMKAAHPKNGWKRNDPFMMSGPGDQPNIVYEALNGRGGLPPSLRSDSGALPISALEATDTADLRSMAHTDGSVSVSTDVTDSSAAALRHLTPAVIGDDRIPRWIPTRARTVRSFKDFINTTTEPTSVHETFSSLDLDANGGHPVLLDGEHIVFTLDDGVQMKVPRGLGAGQLDPLGRSSIDRPVLEMQRLGPDDLDPDLFVDPSSGPLSTHSWAAISSELDDDQIEALGWKKYVYKKGVKLGEKEYDLKKSKAALVAELNRAGYKPIPMRGTYGGVSEDSFLVFGITPEDALTIGEKFGQDSVLTNSGALYNRQVTRGVAGTVDPINGIEFTTDPDNMSELVIGGKTIRWRADVSWESFENRPASMVERAPTQSRRVKLSVKDAAKIEHLANEIESRGGRDLSIYTSRSNLEGWARATEEVVTDGSSTTVARYASGNPASAHGGPVFVRHTDGLPAAPPSPTGARTDGARRVVGNSLVIDANFPDLTHEWGEKPFDVKIGGQKPLAFGYLDGTLTPIIDEAEVTSGRFPAIIRTDGRIIPADPSDLKPAVHAFQDLRAAEWDGVLKLEDQDGNRFKFAEPTTPKRTETITIAGGLQAAPAHRDRLSPDFAERFGFDFDPGYRSGRSTLVLPDDVQSSIGDVTELFMASHGDAVRRYRLSGVTVSDAPEPDIYAYLEPEPGGKIVLAKQWWSDPERLATDLAQTRQERVLTNRAPATPESILVHEYGHVLHMALRLDEGTKGSIVDAELRKIAGGRGWQKRATREISYTAGRSESELVAEAYAEVVAGNPSALAQNVYDFVADRLGSALQIGRAVNGW